MTLIELMQQMRERDEMVRRLAEGPLADLRRNDELFRQANQMTRVIGDMERNSVAAVMKRLAAPEFLTALETAARQASETMHRLRAPEMLAAMERAAAVQTQLAQFAERAVFAHEGVARQIGAMALQINATLKALPTIDFERIGTLVSLTDTPRARLGLATRRLVVRHTRYVDALAVRDSALHRLPSNVQALPTQDVFVHTGAVRSVTPHDAAEPEVEETSLAIRLEISTSTIVFLEATLPALHAPFLDQYRGAKARSADRGPDWWTQGSASLRKLVKGVLHRAAPNDLVLPWAKANNKLLDRIGRPTRATKIEWLCVPVGDDDYRAFVRAELDSTLALIDIVDAAQHVDRFPDFEERYNWVLLRVEMAIRHILELWKLRQ
jgi:hypothetical protein